MDGHFPRCLCACRVHDVAGVPACPGLAVVTKSSGILLAPILILLLALAVLQRSAITMRAAVAVAGVVTVATLTAIWAIYGFRYAPSSSPGWLLDIGNRAGVQQ